MTLRLASSSALRLASSCVLWACVHAYMCLWSVWMCGGSASTLRLASSSTLRLASSPFNMHMYMYIIACERVCVFCMSRCSYKQSDNGAWPRYVSIHKNSSTTL